MQTFKGDATAKVAPGAAAGHRGVEDKRPQGGWVPDGSQVHLLEGKTKGVPGVPHGGGTDRGDASIEWGRAESLMQGSAAPWLGLIAPADCIWS